jgi:hypothetical protein
MSNEDVTFTSHSLYTTQKKCTLINCKQHKMLVYRKNKLRNATLGKDSILNTQNKPTRIMPRTYDYNHCMCR